MYCESSRSRVGSSNRHLGLPGGGEVPGLHDEAAPAHVLLLRDLEVGVQRGQRGVQTRPGGQPLLQGPPIWLTYNVMLCSGDL